MLIIQYICMFFIFLMLLSIKIIIINNNVTNYIVKMADTFLFTSESVNEGHPGMLLLLLFFSLLLIIIR